MKQFTDITILLDRSGSMSSIKEAMEAAFNKFIDGHKVNPSTRISLVQFDDINDQEVVYQSVPVGAVERLNLKPRGGTPLLDAMAKLIDRTGLRYSEMPEYERPDQVLTVIITDGMENASRTFTRRNVFDRVKHQHNNYKWQFIYLGANQDAIGEAASFGISKDWALNYAATTSGTSGALAGLTANTVSYGSNVGAMRGSSVKSFTPTQRNTADDSEPDMIEITKTIKKGKI